MRLYMEGATEGSDYVRAACSDYIVKIKEGQSKAARREAAACP